MDRIAQQTPSSQQDEEVVTRDRGRQDQGQVQERIDQLPTLERVARKDPSGDAGIRQGGEILQGSTEEIVAELVKRIREKTGVL